MRTVWIVMVAAILAMSSGCMSVAPDTVTTSKNLEGDHVIFFEQSDRIPKEVLLAANNDKGAAVNAMMAIPPEVIAKVIEELFKVFPEIAKQLSNERMENSLIQRRILLKGYSGEELKDVVKIIEAFNGSIEFITPQGAKPTVKAFEVPAKK